MTWSNLGSALWALHNSTTTPSLLPQALKAYQKAASLAHSNWRLWENVLTLCLNSNPPPLQPTTHALTRISQIRAHESAIPAPALALLIPRQDKHLVAMLESHVVPLITSRADLWSLVARSRALRGEAGGAVKAAEGAWRAAFAALSSDSASASACASEEGGGDERWEDAVKRTGLLVETLRSWQPDWKGRAASAVKALARKADDERKGGRGWDELVRLADELDVAIS
ncbi:hypothetical protein CDD80_4401 [Ophiocordyceps camponoti-rufipedis]|uniref:Uncharacterized protein n=1 Tax=Ophiocordyceps camponoti-rufipedis TaxID=2004952 RepID=A0A2C5Z0C9_9HYPO|nr:hypothetical protein CDD80_4401 [Ophiocordyceps camponoti-rufipedis]